MAKERTTTMLVLSRKEGERILIGDDIRITVVRLSGGGVRLGIEAPPEAAIVREELALRMQDAQDAAQHKPTKTSAPGKAR
jgi:carbon storage regulator